MHSRIQDAIQLAPVEARYACGLLFQLDTTRYRKSPEIHVRMTLFAPASSCISSGISTEHVFKLMQKARETTQHSQKETSYGVGRPLDKADKNFRFFVCNTESKCHRVNVTAIHSHGKISTDARICGTDSKDVNRFAYQASKYEENKTNNEEYIFIFYAQFPFLIEARSSEESQNAPFQVLFDARPSGSSFSSSSSFLSALPSEYSQSPTSLDRMDTPINLPSYSSSSF